MTLHFYSPGESIGSAWEYDDKTGEYYLHLYATEQPDLNWDNPDVRAELHRLMRHWLNKGVDGFRIDVINFVSKHPDLPDAPVTDTSQPWQNGSMYYACGPRLHEYLSEMGQILLEYDAFSVGEMPWVFDPKEILKAVNFDRHELAMVFHFEMYVNLPLHTNTRSYYIVLASAELRIL